MVRRGGGMVQAAAAGQFFFRLGSPSILGSNQHVFLPPSLRRTFDKRSSAGMCEGRDKF